MAVLKTRNSLTNEEIIFFFNIIHSSECSEEEKRKAREEVFFSINNYIMSVIHTNFKSYVPTHYDDMYNACVIAVYNKMDSYNPNKLENNKNLLCVYFKRDIFFACRSVIENEVTKVTTYYSNQLTVCNREIKELEAKNINWTPQLLTEILNNKGYKISLLTVNRCLDMKNNQNEVSLDVDGFDKADDFGIIPEQAILNNEFDSQIVECFSVLEENEKNIVLYLLGISFENNKIIIENEKKHTVRQASIEFGLTDKEINQFYNKAITKIKKTETLKNMYKSKFIPKNNKPLTIVEYLNNKISINKKLNMDFDDIFGDLNPDEETYGFNYYGCYDTQYYFKL